MSLGFGGGVAGGGGGVAENTAVTFKSLTLASPDANTAFLSGTGVSITGSSTVGFVSLSGTLNTSGVVDVDLISVTNTSSGSGSTLINRKVGGSSKFKVDLDGYMTCEGYMGRQGSGSGCAIDIWAAGNITLPQSGVIDFTNNRTKLRSPADHVFQLGSNHATAAVSQIIKGPDTTTGTGGGLKIRPGTGSVFGSSLRLEHELGNVVIELLYDYGATAGAIGFFEHSPAVQQSASIASATLTSTGGTALTDTDTFNGYTIGQLFTALQAYGLLA